MKSNVLDGVLSRRTACAAVAFAPLLAAARNAVSVGKDAEAALTSQLALLRRAYQTGDADLMRDFYGEEIIFLIEGAAPVIGLQAMTALGRKILPLRRDAEIEVLRSAVDEAGLAYQLARLAVVSRDPNEHVPVVTVLLLWRHQPRGWRCIVEMLLKQEPTGVSPL